MLEETQHNKKFMTSSEGSSDSSLSESSLLGGVVGLCERRSGGANGSSGGSSSHGSNKQLVKPYSHHLERGGCRPRDTIPPHHDAPFLMLQGGQPPPMAYISSPYHSKINKANTNSFDRRQYYPNYVGDYLHGGMVQRYLSSYIPPQAVPPPHDNISIGGVSTPQSMRSAKAYARTSGIVNGGYNKDSPQISRRGDELGVIGGNRKSRGGHDPYRGGYDPYWHLNKASLWCVHNRAHYSDHKCAQCELKEDSTSQCSSVNPPPTFTALDNYQPIRPPSRHWCSCSAVFVTTTAFSLLILMLIAAFIIYVEMVLKKKEYIPDPM